MVNNEKVRYAITKVVEVYRAEVKSANDIEKVKMSNEFLKGLAKNDFDMNEFEVMNHSVMKFNEHVIVNKYIGDNPKAFDNLYELAKQGKVVGLVGETGIGKAYSLYIKAKANKQDKIIIALPLTGTTEQMANEYGDVFVGSYGDGRHIKDLISQGARVIVCTWNKLASAIEQGVDFSEYILVKDEVHEFFSSDYRNKVIRPIQASCASASAKFKGIIDVTATPTKINKNKYDYSVMYEKATKIKKNHILYDSVNKKEIINIVNKGKKVIVIQNCTSSLKRYAENTTDNNKEVLYSDNKANSKVYKSIIKNSRLGECNKLFVTDMLNAGLNLYDEDITDIVIVGIVDPSQIAQIDSRPRRVKELNVHIFNDYPKEKDNFRRVEHDLQHTINSLPSVIEELMKSHGIPDYILDTAFSMNTENSPIYKDSEGKYLVDEARLRTRVYDKHYKTRDREQFAVLLREYASNITFRNIETDKEFEAKLKKLTREEREKSNKKIKELYHARKKLVGCVLISNGNELDDNMKAYLERNELSEDELRIGYDMLDLDLNDIGFIKHNIEFTQLVVKENYDLDYAWNWALASENTRKKVKIMIDFLKYKKLRETDYERLKKIFKINPSLFRYDYIYNELSVKTKYIKDYHIPLLLKEMNNLTPMNETIGSTQFNQLLNSIVITKRNKCKCKKSQFYKKQIPSNISLDEAVNHYVVSDYISVKDVAKLLGVDATNITLNKLINK